MFSQKHTEIVKFLDHLLEKGHVTPADHKVIERIE